MTNEEIIALIQYDICLGCDYEYDVSNYECKRCHFGAAIAALKAEPCGDCDKWETDKTACQKCGEPCEDAVKREAVLNTLDAMDKALDEDRTVEHYKELLAECYNALPPVTPKQRTGHWEMPQLDDGMSDPIYYQVRCSECGFDLDPQTWHMELHQYGADKYCPNCGAKMEEE